MQDVFINKSSGMGFIILDKTDVFYKLKNMTNKSEFNISKNDFEMMYYKANSIEASDFKEFYSTDEASNFEDFCEPFLGQLPTSLVE